MSRAAVAAALLALAPSAAAAQGTDSASHLTISFGRSYSSTRALHQPGTLVVEKQDGASLYTVIDAGALVTGPLSHRTWMEFGLRARGGSSRPRSKRAYGSIARVFADIGDLLEIKNENPFKVRAYRSAADTIGHLAGPAASLFLGGLLLGLARLLDEAGPGPAESVAGIAFWLGAINVLLGFFNLVPGFPMDGGRILRGLLWRLSADFVRATRIATLVGRAVAYVMIGAGFLIALNGDVVGGLWLAFVGWFLNTAAESSYRRVALERLVAGVRVGEVMERDAPTVHPNLTLDVFVDQYLVSGAATAYAVTIEGDLFGTIGLEQVRATPREDWPAARVTDVMTRLAEAPTATADEPLWDAIERFEEGRLQLLPVTDGRRLLGVVTRETLLRALRARAELSA